MAKHPIEAFRNPVSRPRAIIWTGVVLIAFVLFVTVAIAATSSYWFCASVCHKVQDDTIAAYQNSSHNQVSCIACHLPSGGNPVIFMYHKVKSAIGELPMTFANTFELPLNPQSTVSLSSEEFPDTQCTQCHDMNTRKVTTSSGIIFDHTSHTNMGIRCTFCHNRVAHNETGLLFVLKDPQSGNQNHGHVDYMTMDGCYRCHSLDANAAAPGQCSVCHEPGTDLTPADHKTSTFMDNHGRMYIDMEKRVEKATVETGQKSPTPDSVRENLRNLAEGEETGEGMAKDFKWPVAPVGTVETCFTCHTKASCEDCHKQKGINFKL